MLSPKGWGFQPRSLAHLKVNFSIGTTIRVCVRHSQWTLLFCWQTLGGEFNTTIFFPRSLPPGFLGGHVTQFRSMTSKRTSALGSVLYWSSQKKSFYSYIDKVYYFLDIILVFHHFCSYLSFPLCYFEVFLCLLSWTCVLYIIIIIFLLFIYYYYSQTSLALKPWTFFSVLRSQNPVSFDRQFS